MLTWHFILCIFFLIYVTAHFSNVHTFWSKKVPIAGHMAVRAALMLCMTTRCQCFLAPHTAKARPVPVATQWHHLLSEINCLSTAGTRISFSSKHACRSIGSFGLIIVDLWVGPRCGGCSVWWAVKWFVNRCLRRRVIYVRPCPSDIYTFWPKESSVAGFMTVRQSIMLRMASRRQNLTTSVTFQTEAVPVFPQRAHFLSEKHSLIASWTNGRHSLEESFCHAGSGLFVSVRCLSVSRLCTLCATATQVAPRRLFNFKEPPCLSHE